MAELVWTKKIFRLIVMIAMDNKVFWIWIWISGLANVPHKARYALSSVNPFVSTSIWIYLG